MNSYHNPAVVVVRAVDESGSVINAITKLTTENYIHAQNEDFVSVVKNVDLMHDLLILARGTGIE